MSYERAELGLDPTQYLSKIQEKKDAITELRFGDVFITSFRDPALPETIEKCIALDVRRNGTMDVHSIIVDENGEECIHPTGGTGLVSRIFEIVDHWDLERVTAGCETGWKLVHGDELPIRLRELLKRESEMPSYKVSP